MDYLDIKSKITDDKIKALSLFSEKDIVNIIKNSDKYIKKAIFIGEEKTNYLAKKEAEIIKARNKNLNLSYVYQDEIKYCNSLDDSSEIDRYTDFIDYIDSTGKTICKDNIQKILEVDNISFINEDGQFINSTYKNLFISNILIPLFINVNKLSWIKHQEYSSNKELDNLQLNEFYINKIAKFVIQNIKITIDETNLYKKIKKEKISLKILIDIQYIKQFNKEDVVSVEYILNNQTFEKYTFEDHGEGFHISNGMGAPSEPDIFTEIQSEALHNKIYLKYFYNGKNKLHEESTSIPFLSYKNGYYNLIGVFNDMLGFDKMQYIGPLRFYPERDSSFKELDSDESVMPDSQTSWSYLKKDENLRDKINIWLKDSNKLKTPYEIKYRELYDISSVIEKTKDLNFDEIMEKYLNIYESNKFGMDFDEDTFVVDENNSIHPKDKQYMFSAILKSLLKHTDSKEELVFEDLRNGTKISNRDLGLGISQILPVLIATNRQKDMTIAIEQPELHLHPAVQCEIADEFIRSYKENNNNFMIETHSEHLLLRIMKRMRHKAENKKDRDITLDLTPADVCLLYVDSDGTNTFINELELDEDGSLLDPWPNGFFEEGHKERFD